MNRIEQLRRRRPAAPLYLLAVLALLAAQGQARRAVAQSQWAPNGDNIHNTNAGNVGIGTNAPEGTLHIESTGTTVFKSVSSGSATTGRSIFQMYRGTAATSFGWDFGYNADLSSENYIIRELTNGVPTTRFTLAKNTGNVGIGATNPAHKLDVGGNINASGLCIGGDCKTSWPQAGGSQWTTSGSNVYYDVGNVGVGASAPEAPLHVAGTVLSTGPQAGLNFRDRGTGGMGWSWYSNINQARLRFSNATTDALIVFSNGKVGIGLTSAFGPMEDEKLHVIGNVRVQGTLSATNVNAKYQDMAEWVPSTQTLAAGTVVVLDTVRSNHVVASSAAYDTKVAGVVAAQPGVLLGERGEGKLMVATTGRVKVRVDATRGPVRVGDLLVTSDVEGLAMKSEPVAIGGRQMHLPGTLIGKALEPLEKGVGEILVLLSLQ